MKKHITFALLFAAALTAQAQQGGISGVMLNQIKQSYKATPADKASNERKIVGRLFPWIAPCVKTPYQNRHGSPGSMPTC